MQYRAKCPVCNYRFGRVCFFRLLPEHKHYCPSCGAGIKSNSLWEWGFSGVLALPVIGSYFFWKSSVLCLVEFLCICVVVMFIGLIVFPYATKFDLLEKGSEKGSGRLTRH